MKGKILILVVSLLLGGCNVKYVEFNDNIETIDKESEELVVKKDEIDNVEDIESIVYKNVVDGLINTENEMDLKVYYMLLEKSNKKVGSTMTPTYIVIHNTANSAPAINEAKYLNSSSNTSSTSFHFAVDDTSVYQTVNLKYNSWHAGNISMNKKSIGIEIAKSTISNSSIKDKAIENGAKLAAMLMKYYDIPIDRVITHNDVTGKDCPHDILHRYGYNNFLKLVENYLV